MPSLQEPLINYNLPSANVDPGPAKGLKVFDDPQKDIIKYGALAGMIVGVATIFIVKNYVKIEGECFYELLPGFFWPS